MKVNIDIKHMYKHKYIHIHYIHTFQRAYLHMCICIYIHRGGYRGEALRNRPTLVPHLSAPPNKSSASHLQRSDTIRKSLYWLKITMKPEPLVPHLFANLGWGAKRN